MIAFWRLVLRTLALSVLWLALSGGGYPVYGVPTVLLALALSCALSPPWAKRTARRGKVLSRFVAVLRLALWFVVQSIKGGVDVGLRAVRRPLDVDPHYDRLPVMLPEGPALDLSLLMICLLPGSLAVRIDGGELCLHILSPQLAVGEQWRTLQQLVAAATGTEVRQPA